MADTIEKYNAKGNPVAGVIVEPIQSEGGDHEASPEFFLRLQKLCKEVCVIPLLKLGNIFSKNLENSLV